MRLGPVRAGCCASRATPAEPCLTLTAAPSACVACGGVPPAVRGGRAGGGGGRARWYSLSPPPHASPMLIDVVTSCSPGPGLSRAGRGTDIPGEWDRSSRSARGPLSSPAPHRGAWKGRGADPGPAARSCLLPDGSRRGARPPDAADPLRPPLGCVSRAALLPRGGVGAVPPARRVPPLGRASAFRPAVCGAPGALRVVPQVPEAELAVVVSRSPRAPAGRRCGGLHQRGPGGGSSRSGEGTRPSPSREGIRAPVPGRLSDRDGGRASAAGRWLSCVRAADFFFLLCPVTPSRAFASRRRSRRNTAGPPLTSFCV